MILLNKLHFVNTQHLKFQYWILFFSQTHFPVHTGTWTALQHQIKVLAQSSQKEIHLLCQAFDKHSGKQPLHFVHPSSSNEFRFSFIHFMSKQDFWTFVAHAIRQDVQYAIPLCSLMKASLFDSLQQDAGSQLDPCNWAILCAVWYAGLINKCAREPVPLWR